MTRPCFRRDERGDTLVELLVAMVIIAISIAALIGALATSIITSDVHRKQTNGDVMLRTWSEAVKNATYASSGGCTGTKNAYSYATLLGSPPAGFAAPALPVLSIWSGSSWNQSPSDAVCNGAPMQKVTLVVRTTDGRATESVDVVRLLP